MGCTGEEERLRPHPRAEELWGIRTSLNNSSRLRARARAQTVPVEALDRRETG